MISIKKGIDLPISGVISDTTIHDFMPDAHVAIVGDDFMGMKPSMFVAVGDKVQKGQALLEDKKIKGVKVCAPVAGEIVAIERGERRKLLSVVIKPDPQGGEKTYDAIAHDTLAAMAREDIVARLTDSGVWTALRTRPFDKCAAPESVPHAIFVNAMDTNPLAFDPLLTVAGREDDYTFGMRVLARLTASAVHVCHAPDANLPRVSDAAVKEHVFAGIHPAGLVGTHIHFIEPVGEHKTVWHIALQDVLAIGHLFRVGKIDNSKVVAIAGPGVETPKLVRTVRGADMHALLAGNLKGGTQRVISGSVFAGRKAEAHTHYLGHYDQQISVVPEDNDPVFLEFVRPGFKTYSRTRAYFGHFLKGIRFPLTTAVQGSPRPIVPFGIFEDVMPLDVLPTLLVKALIVKDTDMAKSLGALELAEEDMALLTYVDPGKHDFGAILRENLTLIEQEG
ncbi:MAG: Na(+)-translocating NADH-quinone reductase subunit A [Cardiobacteriaceae bacterium]|nr:Na(+)-translocating NADH-quinone reductase subunit A [Cardiobacteriaceae bacterium]